MSVARRLRGALIAFVVLITVVLAFHVRTMRSAADRSRALAEISSRLQSTSTDQLARLTQMSSDGEKFRATRDSAYLERALETGRAFGAELARLSSQDLSRAERSALVRLAVDWRTSAPDAIQHELGRSATRPTEATLTRFQGSLDRLSTEARALANATQARLVDELASIDAAARASERGSMIVALGALVLMVLLSAHLVAAIVGPLARLGEGTKQVAAGRFDYRLDTTGDDELAQVARDFNSMTERLGELDDLKRGFVARVSHDLKTPLSSMQETAGAVLDGLAGPTTDRQRQLLALNLESGKRLSSMLAKLLELSRLEAKTQPVVDLVDLRRVIEEAVVGMVPLSAELSAQLKLDLENELLVAGDPIGFSRVVDNLLENALKFSPSRSHILITGRRTSNGVVVSVADSGPGVPIEERERIFEPFYQTELGRSARARGVGTGLGLAICREIVAAHRGRIWVSENQPLGSVFSFAVPAAAGVISGDAARVAA